MNAIEIIGFTTAVLGIFLSAKKKIFAWPILIISSLAYAYFFFEIKLYADALLQFFFVGTSVFAWFQWKQESKHSQSLKVKSLSILKLLMYLLITLIIGKVFGLLLTIYTDASYAEYDSLLFATSIFASILSAKLFLENWYLWIVVNISYIVLYIFKDAYITAFLYAILLGIAIMGLRDWKKQLHA
jgi:nicotinamide mononucleotide transporter